MSLRQVEFSEEAWNRTVYLSDLMDVDIWETVRRGQILLDMLCQLTDDEQLSIYNKRTKQHQLITFNWSGDVLGGVK